MNLLEDMQGRFVAPHPESATRRDDPSRLGSAAVATILSSCALLSIIVLLIHSVLRVTVWKGRDNKRAEVGPNLLVALELYLRGSEGVTQLRCKTHRAFQSSHIDMFNRSFSYFRWRSVLEWISMANFPRCFRWLLRTSQCSRFKYWFSVAGVDLWNSVVVQFVDGFHAFLESPFGATSHSFILPWVLFACIPVPRTPDNPGSGGGTRRRWRMGQILFAHNGRGDNSVANTARLRFFGKWSCSYSERPPLM